MTHVYVGLGSNLDGPELQLTRAVSKLGSLSGTQQLACSSFYCSKPVGPQDQSDFINAVIMLDTDLSALALLEHLQMIETHQGRVRKVERWGPRTLDLDLLLFGDEQINEENLVVPHQEMHKRNFVLYPLHEIAPTLVIPGRGPVEDLLNHIGSDGIEKVSI